jgi:hypothetical protein
MPQGVQLNKNQIVLLSILECGGASKPVDTEDIAMRCHQIAPDRFSWRKYRDQIDLQKVRQSLFALRKTYLTGSESKGWSLNSVGFAEANILAGKDGLSVKPARPTSKEERWLRHEKSRLTSSEAFSKYSKGAANDIHRQEALDLLRVDEYVSPLQTKRKIETLQNLFAGDSDLIEFISALWRASGGASVGSA